MKKEKEMKKQLLFILVGIMSLGNIMAGIKVTNNTIYGCELRSQPTGPYPEGYLETIRLSGNYWTSVNNEYNKYNIYCKGVDGKYRYQAYIGFYGDGDRTNRRICLGGTIGCEGPAATIQVHWD